MDKSKHLSIKKMWIAIMSADMSFLIFVIRLVISIFTKNFSKDIISTLITCAIVCLVSTFYVVYAVESCDNL